MDSTPAERSAAALERIAALLEELVKAKRPGPKPAQHQTSLPVDDPQDAIAAIPCQMGDTFFVYKHHASVWEGAYPLVDVEQTLKEITAWAASNASLRWTHRGALRGINRWMHEEQNKLATAAARRQVNGGR